MHSFGACIIRALTVHASAGARTDGRRHSANVQPVQDRGNADGGRAATTAPSVAADECTDVINLLATRFASGESLFFLFRMRC